MKHISIYKLVNQLEKITNNWKNFEIIQNYLYKKYIVHIEINSLEEPPSTKYSDETLIGFYVFEGATFEIQKNLEKNTICIYYNENLIYNKNL